MRYYLAVLILPVMVCLLGGCNTIQVVDDHGVPVAGASVEAVSLSMNTGPNMTDTKGETVLPYNIQGAKWVQITKPGYQKVFMDVPTTWPLRVKLDPSGAGR